MSPAETSEDQLPKVDLSDTFGTRRKSSERAAALAGATLTTVTRRRTPPPARTSRPSPPLVVTAAVEAESVVEQPTPTPAATPSRTPAKRRSAAQTRKPAGKRKKSPPRSSNPDGWATQTLSNVPAAAQVALDAEVKRRGVGKGDLVLFAMRTHLADAIAELAAARLEARAPCMPAIPGDQTHVRTVVRMRNRDRDRIRNEVESALDYRGALSDAYRYCLLALLATAPAASVS